MIIFGTIGVFVRNIPLPSSAIALVRAVVGVVFLIGISFISKKKVSFSAVKRNLLLLILSGAALGFNWILLFEAYRYTTVATATLCYYLAPTFVIVASPFVLKEKLSVKKSVCVVISLIGMVFVSGVITSGFKISELTGVLFGIGAAVLYAAIILINKKMKDISSFDMTVAELLVSAVVLTPYVLLTEDFSGASLKIGEVFMLLLVGVVHTGVAYALYFASITKVSGSTVALFSYIDPVCAIILSATVLREGFTFYSFLGALLILGASVLGELKNSKKSEKL